MSMDRGMLESNVTWHAYWRIYERSLTDDHLAAALAGRIVEKNEKTYCYDKHTRTLIVAENGAIKTAYRATKRRVKRLLSR
jgi:hypothetical protein